MLKLGNPKQLLMCRTIFSLLLFQLAIGGSSSGQTSFPTKSDTVSSTPPTYHYEVTPNQYELVGFFEPGQSMRSGAENIFALHHAITGLEDKLFGHSWFGQNPGDSKFADRSSRFAKYVFVDLPTDFFLILINHEYYGHASRYREFDLGIVEYKFNPPPPYGEGGGYANVSGYNRPTSYQEKILIWQAGMEAHDMLNRRLSLEWIMRGSANYHESILYLWNWQDRFQYIQWENDELPEDLNGPMYDPEGYVWFLNRSAGFEDPHNLRFKLTHLRKSGLISLADPFVWYSLYNQFVGYIYAGNPSGPVPMVNLGDIKYLPSLRMSLTPYGPQYHIENYFKWSSRVSLIDFQIGDDVFFTDWWGLGVTLQGLKIKESVPLNMKLHIWDHPAFYVGDDLQNSQSEGLGVAFMIKGQYVIPDDPYSLILTTEIGYKTAGFIQGYPIDATPLFMLGFGFRSSKIETGSG